MESDGRLALFLSHSNMNNKLPNIKCKHCQKEFEPKYKKRIFCSMGCRTTFNNLNVRDYNKNKQ
jgi:hypothetical protein